MDGLMMAIIKTEIANATLPSKFEIARCLAIKDLSHGIFFFHPQAIGHQMRP